MKREQKIENILNSLEGVQRSAPRPFFFTRLEARLQSNASFVERLIAFVSRPSVAFATLAIIILLNGIAIFSAGNQAADQQAATTEIASVDEYVQVSANLFDSDKSNP